MTLSDRLHEARANYFAARQRQLRQRGNFADALAILVDEASWTSREMPNSPRWLTLLIEATEIASQLKDTAEYRAFLNYFADHLLGEGPAGEQALWEALALLEDLHATTILEELGSWLSLTRPDWSAGPYLQGHALEVRASDAPDSLASAAESFGRAAQCADATAERTHSDTHRKLARHCRLRQASIQLRAGDRPRGQETLSHINWSELARAEQLWMARALTHSERWIDRVRVIDLLLDSLRHHASSAPDELRAIARDLLSNAPLRLHPIETERLPELLDLLFEDEERAHWQRHLQTRERLQHLADAPISDARAPFDALATLERLATDAPARWQAVARHAAMLLHTPVTDEAGQPETGLSRTNLDAIEEVYAALADLLSAAQLQALQPAHVVALNAAAGALGDEVGALRALGLVWPAVLPPPGGEASTELHTSLQELARLHARAASPSYGWWALAAHLFRAELPACAWHIAQRARQSSEAGTHPDIINYVKTHTLKAAASRKDAAGASLWLSTP